MTQLTALSISQRFQEECDYIDKFVGLLDLATLDIYSLIREVAHSLQKFGLLTRRNSYRSPWAPPRDDIPLSVARLQALSRAIQTQRPKVQVIVQDSIKVLRERNSQSAPNASALWRGAEALITDCIEFLSSVIPEDAEYHDLSNLKAPLLEQLRRRDGGSEIYDDNIDFQETMEAIVDLAIHEAWIDLARRKLGAADQLDRALDKLDLTIRFLRPDAEVHVWRQGFINLMTVFEASVFDITRLAFHNDFFRVLKGFTVNRKPGEKLSLQELSSFGSYDVFQNSTIESQLRGVYLKELLFILRSLGADGVATPAEPHFATLIELVLRRNVHIHNRGRVDEGYLMKDHEGTQLFNLYGLQFGALAIIDDSYYATAVDTCSLCVKLLAEWADHLAQT
jgi:hypothetical protein